MHDVITAMRANRRSGTASTKTKATVSGSGKKPYKQKGTGRARAGYMSSPVRVGGGVVFGPHPRDYSKKVTKSVKRLAFRKALSSRIIAGDVSVVDAFAVGELKTKAFVALVGGHTDEKKKVLIIGDQFDAHDLQGGPQRQDRADGHGGRREHRRPAPLQQNPHHAGGAQADRRPHRRARPHADDPGPLIRDPRP